MILSWLVANVDAFRSSGRYLRQSGPLSNGNWYLVAAVVAIALFWVGLYYWDKYRRRETKPGLDPSSLLLELCAAHGLGRTARALLLQAAETRRLAQPAILFVDPTILRELEASGAPEAAEYATLARRLFG